MCAVQPSSVPTNKIIRKRSGDLAFVDDSRLSVKTKIIFLTPKESRTYTQRLGHAKGVDRREQRQGVRSTPAFALFAVLAYRLDYYFE